MPATRSPLRGGSGRSPLDRQAGQAVHEVEVAKARLGLGGVVPVAWRHDVAALLIDRIVVNPAPRKGTRFDPSRVDVEWRA